jgi:RNA polymerase sigma-70 factor (ECF subfamily)
MEFNKTVSLAKKGDKKAYMMLIQENEASMYRTAKAILRSEEDCRDAIQETIIKAYEGITKLRFNEYFKTWLLRILINECNKILRVHKKEIVLENGVVNYFAHNEDEIKQLEGSYSFNEVDNLDLNRALTSLEPELKMVVILFYFEDLSIKEISKVTGTPQGTIKSRLSRARSKLKEKLEVVEGGIFCE